MEADFYFLVEIKKRNAKHVVNFIWINQFFKWQKIIAEQYHLLQRNNGKWRIGDQKVWISCTSFVVFCLRVQDFKALKNPLMFLLFFSK